MSNLLQTASNWNDGTVSPPACWNGTAYVFTALVTLTLTATAAAGDTLAGTFAGTNQGQGHQIAVTVNGVSVLTWNDSSDSFPASLDATLAAGDAVVIQLLSDLCGYAPDFSLTPPALPPLAKRLQFEVRVGGDPEGTP